MCHIMTFTDDCSPKVPGFLRELSGTCPMFMALPQG